MIRIGKSAHLLHQVQILVNWFLFISIAALSSPYHSNTGICMEMSTRRIIYEYPLPLLSGRLSRRYKRFLADVYFDSDVDVGDEMLHKGDENVGEGAITTHCPNTGSLATLLPPFNDDSPRVLMSKSSNAKRKLSYTLEAIYQHKSNSWVGLHSSQANKMVKQSLMKGWISELVGFSQIRDEVKISHTSTASKKRKSSDDNIKNDDDSRIDFQLTWGDVTEFFQSSEKTNPFESFIHVEETCNSSPLRSAHDAATSNKFCSSSSADETTTISPSFHAPTSLLLEVKSVTYSSKSGLAEFPDCVSTRGQKHLRVLMSHIKENPKTNAAAIIFLIQRSDISTFSACKDKDPIYHALLNEAEKAGVLILPYTCNLDPQLGTVELIGKVPFIDAYKESFHT